MFLLDTNVIILFGKRVNALLVQRLQRAFDEDQSLYVPAIVAQELELGALRDRNPEARRRKNDLILRRTSGILDYTARDALIAADVQHRLMAKGEMIGAYDLLIAAQCLRTDATLITHNTRHFLRVPGVRCEDWVVD